MGGAGTGARAAGSLLDTAGNPSETRRLLTEWAQSMSRTGAPWSATLLDWATSALSEGRFAGRLWVGPKDEAVGLAVGLPPTEVGGRVEIVYLSDGYRAAPVTRAFLARLDRPDAFGPLVELPDPPPGHDPAEYAAAVEPLGFAPVRRVDMRFPGDRPPPSAGPLRGATLRTMRPDDAEAVATLTARAYQDNPTDMALFRRFRDPMADARAATAMLLGTSLGEWYAFASFVVEDSDGMAGATIVNDHGGPLITEVMVDPRARKQGHATRLLGATITALRAAGRPEPRLVVTLSNERARRLYEKVGFVEDPSTVGARWLHVERLGLRSSSAPPP